VTPKIVLAFAQAYGAYCQSGRLVLGRNSRVCGRMLQQAVTTGLMAVGCEVVDIGIPPTPTTKTAAEKLHAAGASKFSATNPGCKCAPRIPNRYCALWLKRRVPLSQKNTARNWRQ
jgi:phosphomannomutase